MKLLSKIAKYFCKCQKEEQKADSSQVEQWLSKFPDFNPEWSNEAKLNWFNVLIRIIETVEGKKDKAAENDI